jgi:hypothetical protein
MVDQATSEADHEKVQEAESLMEVMYGDGKGMN